MANTVLCFVADARPFLAGLARATVPGGRVVVGDLGARSTWGLARRLRAIRGDPLWAGARFQTLRRLRRLLADAGLQPAGWSSAVGYPRFLAGTPWAAVLERLLAGRTDLGVAYLAVAGTRPH